MATYTIKSIQLPNGDKCNLSDASAIKKNLISVKGDLIYASAANIPERLAIGNVGAILTATTNGPRWSTILKLDTNNAIVTKYNDVNISHYSNHYDINTNKFTGIDIKDTIGNTISQFYSSVEIEDNHNEVHTYLRTIHYSDAMAETVNQLIVGVKKDNNALTPFYFVSSPAAFRQAIAIDNEYLRLDGGNYLSNNMTFKLSDVTRGIMPNETRRRRIVFTDTNNAKMAQVEYTITNTNGENISKLGLHVLKPVTAPSNDLSADSSFGGINIERPIGETGDSSYYATYYPQTGVFKAKNFTGTTLTATQKIYLQNNEIAIQDADNGVTEVIQNQIAFQDVAGDYGFFETIVSPTGELKVGMRAKNRNTTNTGNVSNSFYIITQKDGKAYVETPNSLKFKRGDVVIRDDADNDITANRFIGIDINDSNNFTYAQFYGSAELTNSKTQAYMKATNIKTDGTLVTNQFTVGVNKNGTRFYSVTEPAKFRKDMGVQCETKMFSIEKNSTIALTLSGGTRCLIFGNSNTGAYFMILVYCDTGGSVGYTSIITAAQTTFKKGTEISNNSSEYGYKLQITNTSSSRPTDCTVIITTGSVT